MKESLCGVKLNEYLKGKCMSEYDKGFLDALEAFLEKYNENPLAALCAAKLTVSQGKEARNVIKENK